MILCDLVLTETKKYEKTKNFFVIVCYKEWQKRKLLTKIPISVKFFLFSFVIRSGLSVVVESVTFSDIVMLYEQVRTCRLYLNTVHWH